MPTCSRWTWVTLGSRPMMPKNLPKHCSKQLALTYQDEYEFALVAASHGSILGAYVKEPTLLGNLMCSQQRKSD